LLWRPFLRRACIAEPLQVVPRGEFNRMIVKREILLKAIVTEQLKNQLREGVKETLEQIDQGQEEMERQYRRLMLEVQRMDAGRAMAVRQQVDAERRRQDDAKKELQDQLAEYEELQLGEEFVMRVLEGTVEIREGDNFFDKIRRAEIIVEDDIVKELREP
jgi:capsule polysaccharide export protein KpsE/RkpR